MFIFRTDIWRCAIARIGFHTLRDQNGGLHNSLGLFFRLPDIYCSYSCSHRVHSPWRRTEKECNVCSRETKEWEISTWLLLPFHWPDLCHLTYLFCLFSLFHFKLSTLKSPTESPVLGRSGEWMLGSHLVVSPQRTSSPQDILPFLPHIAFKAYENSFPTFLLKHRLYKKMPSTSKARVTDDEFWPS